MEKQSFFKRNQFIILAIVLFLAMCFVYFSPIVEGRVIQQSDVEHSQGGMSEVSKYKETTGRYALWTNAIFSGMPTYLLWLGYPSNIAGYMLNTYLDALPNPINTVFLYLVGFFILLRTLRMNVWLSVLGAVAFAFSSYNFIIIAAGHTNKAIVIGLFAPTLAGVIMAYRGRVWQGAGLAAVALALQLKANHFQMSYYLALAIGIYVIFELVNSVKEKTLPVFFKASALLAVGAIIAVGINITPLMLTEEYSHESIRGKTELTLNPKASQDGLNQEYAYEYSYGIGETLTLLVPNVYGGASAGSLSKNSETYQFLQSRGVPNSAQIIKQLPLYWGDQFFTAGPVYFGALVMFLFILGLFVVKGKEKWWILTTVLLTVMLSWGKNFLTFSNIFFDYFPYYNKFRAVSSMLTVTSLMVPLLAVLALKEIIEEKVSKKELLKYFRNTALIVGGILLLLIVFPSLMGSFTNEAKDKNTFGDSYEQIIGAISADRASLLRTDALRSLAFIVLGAGLLIAFIQKKINQTYLLAGLILLVVVDMWTIDKRYLNDMNFVKKSKNAQGDTQPSAVDQQILQDKDPYYRVYNLTVNPFTDAETSRFHKSIGGYHAAKLKRYQELIENHISKGNMSVLNMLNTKYFIVAPQNAQQPMVQINPNACGNAWLVEEIRYVPSADSEMTALNSFNPATTVIIDERFKERVGNVDLSKDTTAGIKLSMYSPDTLQYDYHSAKENFAVFSEIYYSQGWKAFVDGTEAPYVRVNYLLRGMKLPAGTHKIEFRFAPEKYYFGEKVAFASSIALILFVGMSLFFTFRKPKEERQEKA